MERHVGLRARGETLRGMAHVPKKGPLAVTLCRDFARAEEDRVVGLTVEWFKEALA